MQNEILAHYLLLERIGAGGMGEVYRARDTRLGRTVAVKILPPELVADPDRRTRFMREARAAATLSHPAITALFEFGEADGRLFLSFEYVPGPTLQAVLADGPMHPKRAVPIAIQVADALADAHSAGVVHRDIKPANIIVTAKGSAKVLDFGLASWTTGGKLRETAARAGSATVPDLGTVAYLSPEQALSQPIDSRTDVFSLGVVVYEMLTGRNPFAAPTSSATLVNLLKTTPDPPSQVNRDVPKALDGIVLRMLARDVQSRYGSAAMVASDLRAAYAERTEHVFEDDLPPRQPARRRRWPRIAAVTLFGAAIALGGYTQRTEVRRIWKRWLGARPAPAIAIVPLEEIGHSQTYFADGFTDDLAMRLGQTPGLRVLGRSSTRVSRGRALGEIARETGAAVVLTGTVQRAGEDLDINLELIDPADGVRVWRGHFLNRAESVLAAQAVIADEVARALRVDLRPTEFHERSMARVVSAEAYDTYARGRDALARRDLDEALRLFEQAVRLDDGLAEAFAGIAEALFERSAGRNGLDDGDQARVRQVAVRAAAVEPDLAAVQIAGGLAAGTYREALRHFARAAAHDPTSAAALREIGDRLIHVDTSRAIRLYERSRKLDPRMFASYGGLALAKRELGQSQQAAGEVDALLRADPGNPQAPIMRAWIARGSDSSSVGALRRAAAAGHLPPVGFVSLAQRLASAGQAAGALQVLDSALARTPDLCEAQALRAGLLNTLRGTAQGRAARAALGGSPPRCAALAAAAFGDAAGLAAQLRAVGSHESALRSWIQVRFGGTGEMSLQSGLYPWSQVVQEPDVAAARKTVRTALDGLKRIADEELKGLP